MATGDTQQSVCSTALFHLGAAPLSSFTAPVTPLERRLVSQYQNVLNAELRRRPWVFAILRTDFTDAAAPAVPPAFNTWALPADCLRTLRERGPHSYHVEPDWWVEGRNVCRVSAKAPNMRYISSTVDPSAWDALFVQVFTLKLALQCAEYATQSSQKKQDLASLYTGAMSDAGKNNAWETPEGSTFAPDDAFSWLRDRSNSIY